MQVFRRLVLGLVTAGAVVTMASPALASTPGGNWSHDPSYSKGGVSISVSVSCPSNGTTVTKISSSGGNPGYAARIRDSAGTWHQGAEVSSGTATVYIAAQKTPAHAVRVFWSAASGGAQNYTFC